jgi:hypothetical protein
MDAVDVVLALVAVAVMGLPLAVAVIPLITIITCRRRVVPALMLYLAVLAMLGAYIVAANAHMDWADRTGGQGSILAGTGWLLGAVVAAAGAIWLSVARPRVAPSTA